MTIPGINYSINKVIRHPRKLIFDFNGRIRIKINNKNPRDRRMPIDVNDRHKLLMNKLKFIIYVK